MKLKHTIVAAGLLGIVAANGATISWSAGSASTSGEFGEILNSGLFATTGTLFLAQNIGGPAFTFDSINFADGTSTFFDGDFDGFHQNGQILSEHGSYGNAGSAGTVSLTGLTNGHTYRIQALVFDGRGDPGIPGRTVSFDGINQGQYANGISGTTWGDGLLVTGTFKADATTQDFTIEGFQGASSTGAQLNALTVYTTAVPEPSSAALLGFGGLALILRRRK